MTHQGELSIHGANLGTAVAPPAQLGRSVHREQEPGPVLRDSRSLSAAGSVGAQHLRDQTRFPSDLSWDPLCSLGHVLKSQALYCYSSDRRDREKANLPGLLLGSRQR